MVAAGLAIVAAIGASLLPALAATRPDLSPLLKGGGWSTVGGRRLPYRESLVVAQLVVTFAFLVTAVLCSRSFSRSLDTPLGFDPERLAFATLYRSGPEPRFEEVLEKVRQLPGVQGATLAWAPPAVPPEAAQVRVPERADDGLPAAQNGVRPEYFALSEARLLRGRFLEEADVRLDQPVAVVSAALGRRLWPEGDPLGRSLLIGDSPRLLEIVGIVQDPVEIARVEHSPGKAGAPIVYVPLAARTLGTQAAVTLLVEGGAGAGARGPEIERLVRTLQAGVGISSVRTLADVNRAGLIQVEITSVTYSVLGALSCLLGTVGLYGAIAQMVARRRREIGIRVALGATRRQISSLVLRRGLGLAGAGIGLGIPAAFAAARIFGSAVPDLPPVDTATLVAGTLLVLATALAASYGPARRATQVDPMVTLRHE
jgi:predicted permease